MAGGIPTEEARKRAQRDMREMVLKLQKEGKSKEEIETVKKQQKRKRARVKAGPRPKRVRPGDPPPSAAAAGSGSGSGSGQSAQGQSAHAWRFERFGDARGRAAVQAQPRLKPKPWEGTTPEEVASARIRDNAARRHHLVIIPILWRKREAEADTVREACQSLKNKLMKHRINVWIDHRTALAPGQKYEYWESMGVLFRMEVGPQEAAAGTVCLSKSEDPEPAVAGASQPHQMAQRWKDLGLNTREELHDVLSILKEQGLSWLQVDDECAACDAIKQEEDLKPKKKPEPAVVSRQRAGGFVAGGVDAKPAGKRKTFDEDEDEDEDNGDEEAQVLRKEEDAAAGAKRRAEAGGDDLEGNFVLN